MRILQSRERIVRKEAVLEFSKAVDAEQKSKGGSEGGRPRIQTDKTDAAVAVCLICLHLMNEVSICLRCFK